MTLSATGIGSMPGGDPLAAEEENARSFTEATRIVLGELPDLPHLPELPGRGAGAGMTGRGAALLAGLATDLQPAGWRLTDAPGVDERRARSLLGRDLDVVEELTDGYQGPFKAQVIGPWTLAATLELPRGDKVLADHGARRELAQSLAEGLIEHVRDLRRRLPGATELLLQLDEPALPAVLAGRVPTASGYGRHRTIDLPEASDALGWVCAAVRAAGAEPIVHCCAADAPIALLRRAGAAGIAVDLARLAATGLDELAEAVEAGDRVLLGAAPTSGQVSTKQVVETVSRMFDMIGLEPTDRVVLTPACGLAGSVDTSGAPDHADVRRRLTACREAAATF
ncbi:methionine synthase [Nocardioides daejeonensis]|uniref:methionine synthase n=1 Tax=Nocardioides daejeonensis TaxID=1046556 RepID=UPI001EF51702|nr:methionine synthase [Nocardioides daejeonensis]